MGCKILKRVTWPWPRPFNWRLFIGRVGLAMVNQCIKFEVSRFTRYKAMNSGAKYRKWLWFGAVRGHSGSAAKSPFDKARTTSYSTLIETMCYISYYLTNATTSTNWEVDRMTVHLLPMTIQETLYIGSFIVTFIDCDNTFFLISLFKMRHVIFSLNEYVMLCYVMYSKRD